jgi:hypothetical protein
MEVKVTFTKDGEEIDLKDVNNIWRFQPDERSLIETELEKVRSIIVTPIADKKVTKVKSPRKVARRYFNESLVLTHGTPEELKKLLDCSEQEGLASENDAKRSEVDSEGRKLKKLNKKILLQIRNGLLKLSYLPFLMVILHTTLIDLKVLIDKDEFEQFIILCNTEFKEVQIKREEAQIEEKEAQIEEKDLQHALIFFGARGKWDNYHSTYSNTHISFIRR